MYDLHQKLQQRFPYLSDDELNYLITSGKVTRLREGEVLPREENTDVVMVLSGVIRNYLKVSLREELTVSLTSASQFVPPCSDSLITPAKEITAAATETVVFISNSIPHKVHGDLSKYFLQLYDERLKEFILLSPEQRYSYLQENRGHLLNEVPLKYIASYLGVSVVSLSRIRKRVMQRSRAAVA